MRLFYIYIYIYIYIYGGRQTDRQTEKERERERERGLSIYLRNREYIAVSEQRNYTGVATPPSPPPSAIYQT